MSKLNVVIIDDEKPARELIKAYLAGYTQIEIIGEGSNGFEGIKLIQQLKPDIVFLDIQMPKVSGLEMLEVVENPPKVIFTTAYDQYAIKAFELNAIDYLLKPFSQDRFDSALQKVLSFSSVLSQKKVSQVSEGRDLENQSFLNRVVVKKGSELNVIPIKDIEYIESSDDYVFIHTGSERYIKSRTMKYYEQSLNPEQFVRIHRSYIVNVGSISKIEQYDKENYVAVVGSGVKLKISKSGLKRLKEILKI